MAIKMDDFVVEYQYEPYFPGMRSRSAIARIYLKTEHNQWRAETRAVRETIEKLSIEQGFGVKPRDVNVRKPDPLAMGRAVWMKDKLKGDPAHTTFSRKLFRAYALGNAMLQLKAVVRAMDKIDGEVNSMRKAQGEPLLPHWQKVERGKLLQIKGTPPQGKVDGNTIGEVLPPHRRHEAERLEREVESLKRENKELWTVLKSELKEEIETARKLIRSNVVSQKEAQALIARGVVEKVLPEAAAHVKLAMQADIAKELQSEGNTE